MMKVRDLLFEISKDFLKEKKVYTYYMKKMSEMNEDEVISSCHRYCEENNLTSDFKMYREQIELQYKYCLFERIYR